MTENTGKSLDLPYTKNIWTVIFYFRKMFGLIFACMSMMYNWWSKSEDVADWSLLPIELREIIIKHLVRKSTKGVEFKRMIQEKWFKVNLKRVIKAKETRSKQVIDGELERLFLDIDSLSDLEEKTRKMFHKEIAEHFCFGDQSYIYFSSRWLFGIRDCTEDTIVDILTRIGYNYIKGNVDESNFFFGYILLTKERPAKDIEFLLNESNLMPVGSILLEEYDPVNLNGQDVILGNALLREEVRNTENEKLVLENTTIYSNFIIGRHAQHSN